ncbi:hypothetical protein D3C77_323740 [compost metagenome]
MQNIRQSPGYDRRSLNTGLALAYIYVLGASVLFKGELLRISTLTPRETKRCFAPLSIFVQSDFARRAFYFFVNVLLLVRHLFNQHR